MLFIQLYELVKRDKALHSDYVKEGGEFLRNKGINTCEKPNLAVRLNRICYNNCSFCSYPHTGEYLNLELLLPYIRGAKILQLSGGETFLQPENNLENFLVRFAAINGKKSAIGITTSGLNPDVSEDTKKHYYGNFEKVFKLSEKLNSVNLFFSYSEGIKLDLRLESFISHYAKLFRKYRNNKVFMDFVVLLKNEDESESKTAALKRIIRELPCEIEYSMVTTKEKVESCKIGKRCSEIENYLHVGVKGELYPCCSIFADFKPLPIIARIGEPLKVINDKRFVYYGLLKDFQEHAKSGSNCLVCVNYFPLFIENASKELAKLQ